MSREKPERTGTGAARRIEVPDRKISETILDFGAPFLANFDERTPIDVMRKALMIVITIWNSHVMAMPIWGKPEHLEDLEGILRELPEPPGKPPDLGSLAIRRREEFADDPRAVGRWEVVPDARYGFMFRCEARLPYGVEPLRRTRAEGA